MDICIALRTAVVKDGTLYIQAGGGVVYDSDPEAEFQESVNKSKALTQAARDAGLFVGARAAGTDRVYLRASLGSSVPPPSAKEGSPMSLRINDIAPDFTADTTEGPISFHDWIGDGWAILFSHPKNFTPVCTTELGYMAGMAPEFAKRNAKILGISVDPVENHHKWKADIDPGHRPHRRLSLDRRRGRSRSPSSTRCSPPTPATPARAAPRPTTPRCARSSSSARTRR